MLDKLLFEGSIGCVCWRLQDEITDFCSDFVRQGGNYVIKASLLGSYAHAPCCTMSLYLREPNLQIRMRSNSSWFSSANVDLRLR